METVETLPIAALKPKIEGVPAMSRVLPSNEEQEEDSRDQANPESESSEGVNVKRQAPPSKSMDEAPVQSQWMCMRGVFPIGESIDDFYGWCQSPYNLYTTNTAETPLVSETNRSQSTHPETATTPINPTTTTIKLDEHQSTGQIEDGETIASVSTLGKKIFGDLISLPSASNSRFPRDDCFEDSSTIASVGDLSALSIPNQGEVRTVDSVGENPIEWDTASIASGITLSTANLENAIDEKLRNVDADKTIGDTLKTAVRLIRTSSSASVRSLKRKKKTCHVDSECDQSLKSGHSSPVSVISPRSKSKWESKRASLVRELKSAMETHGRFDIRCANVAAALGDIYEEEKKYSQALKLHREATTIYTTKLGDHHVTTIDAKVRLGKLFEKMGDHDRAIELYFNVLCMRKAIVGETDACVPDTLAYIASALKRKGKVAQAIKELKRALKLYRASLGDSHPRVTSTVDEISALYIIVGDYVKATAILEEVVKLKAATVGVNHNDVAKTLLELATAYEAAGENAKALRSLKKCYSIYAIIHGENSEQATMALERIALNYKNNADTERSVAAYLGVLRGRKNHLGDAHPIVADTYLQLGIALRENKHADKAMKCMKQALSIYVGEGRDMNDVGMIAQVMHEMALLHLSKGQLTDALKIFKQELNIRQKMGERELHQVAVTLHHLGTTELELKNNTKALNFFMEALTIYEKSAEEVGVEFAETLYCTGIVFDATRHQDQAQEAYEESIKVFQAQGLSHKQVDDIVIRLDKLKAPNVERQRSKRINRSRKLIAL
jgi:tetratricopeptide (TPR) repeat protein